jgi:hypothetical protein
MTSSAIPTDPTISEVVPLCGAAPLSQAGLQLRASTSPSTQACAEAACPHQRVVVQPAP